MNVLMITFTGISSKCFPLESLEFGLDAVGMFAKRNVCVFHLKRNAYWATWAFVEPHEGGGRGGGGMFFARATKFNRTEDRFVGRPPDESSQRRSICRRVNTHFIALSLSLLMSLCKLLSLVSMMKPPTLPACLPPLPLLLRLKERSFVATSGDGDKRSRFVRAQSAAGESRQSSANRLHSISLNEQRFDHHRPPARPAGRPVGRSTRQDQQTD